MVEFLLFPAAALLLLALLAVQFLLVGFAYGPRTRRLLALLGVPAAAACAVLVVVLPSRPVARGVAGVATGGFLYLALAVAVVLRRRERKLAELVGDVRALRRQLAERQHQADKLFWQLQGEGRPRAARPRAAAGPARGRTPRGRRGAEIQRIQQTQASQLRAWREELGSWEPKDLAARARVLEAARLDVPEAQRQWLDARLAVLWTVYRERSDSQREAADVRRRWEDARRDVAQLRERLVELQRQRALLRGRRLSLD
jgi:hypothetical protein